MKTILLFVAFLFVASAWAAPSPALVQSALSQQTSCQNFVHYDNTYLYLGFGDAPSGLDIPHHPTPSWVHVVPLDGSKSFDLHTNDSAMDLVSDGKAAYVLTPSGLEQWDLASAERVAIYATYNHSGDFGNAEWPTSLARYQHTLIISHGRLGVSFFDMNSKKITNQYRLIPEQAPLESMATGVSVVGNTAYVVMDDYSLVNVNPPFRGIVLIDMATQEVRSELGGMDPGADAVVSDGNVLLVSFAGGSPIWKYSIADLQGSSLPDPLARVWQFPISGHPTGIASVDSVNFYSCSLPMTGGFVPVTLDRKANSLD